MLLGRMVLFGVSCLCGIEGLLKRWRLKRPVTRLLALLEVLMMTSNGLLLVCMGRT